jgi:hypothetical protein
VVEPSGVCHRFQQPLPVFFGIAIDFAVWLADIALHRDGVMESANMGALMGPERHNDLAGDPLGVTMTARHIEAVRVAFEIQDGQGREIAFLRFARIVNHLSQCGGLTPMR